MPTVDLEHIAAGGNRQPSAADWKPGLLAFGSGFNIALWNPEDDSQRGITALLAGHNDTVNAVRILETSNGRRILSGGADKTIRVWTTSDDKSFKQVQCITEHQGSVNVISDLPGRELFASGSADGTVKIWDCSRGTAKLLQSILLKPRYLPLTCALTVLQSGGIVLAVGGTSTFIQLYARSNASTEFELQATLTGHEGWIRSLDFVTDSTEEGNDVMLASASQDKYIRLWRLHNSGLTVPAVDNGLANASVASATKSLSNKAHRIRLRDEMYNVTFEALLVGHEDWVCTACWAPSIHGQSSPVLLSVSADNSIAMWRADEASGVWVCQTRLGEISSQKGSTTATGSTGGFWIGLWQPDGQGVLSLGRTGSWRRWKYQLTTDIWAQQVGISGHTQEIQSCAWASDGSYLLSTGSDQTTRLFAEWKRNGKRSWHECSRPQIHGYDLNCIDSISTTRFISGADEKLLRVFSKPKAIDHLLSTLCNIASSADGELPDAANIPVLGLSNKAIAPAADDETVNGTLWDGSAKEDSVDKKSISRQLTLELDHPPFEEHLARHTLWPEHEKLYGHGYEISAVASSNDGSLVATACKASSIDHAVIRIYECSEWREVKPSLITHSLTVTSLKFSPDDKYLLSVGRDRTLAVFERHHDTASAYQILWSSPKAHTRMILDCSWATNTTAPVFATAGRDKVVKIWKLIDGTAACVQTITAMAPVTAIAFANNFYAETLRLAYAMEEGGMHILDLEMNAFEVASDMGLEKRLVPSRAVNALRWRPETPMQDPANGLNTAKVSQLATVSDDYSLRIYNIGP